MAVTIALFWALAGFKAVAKSSFNPLAIWFSNSTWVLNKLVVVHAWVKVMPFLKSTYLPSMSPAIAADLASRVPATLKVVGYDEVLTSRDVPWMG
jgi:hypothetical protein